MQKIIIISILYTGVKNKISYLQWYHVLNQICISVILEFIITVNRLKIFNYICL